MINQLRKEGDSIGAKLSVKADNVPIGLGEPVFDKLDAEIARAMMSINAVKAVSLGDGFDVVSQRGSQHRDQMDRNGFRSNHAGGTLGGISSGQSIKVDVAFKPTSSIVQTGETLDLEGQETTIQTKGRHDPCVGVRGLPIAEAMLALTLMDHFLRHRGQNCDIITRTTNYDK
jgi:chorismate synthase